MTDVSEKNFNDIVAEQIGYFNQCDLFKRLPSIDLLQSQVEVSCVEQPSLYRNFSAKINDDPKTDTMTVVIDKPTVVDMSEEFVIPKGLSPEDIKRMYIGIGLANLLIKGSFARANMKRVTKFAEALCEPQGLYARTMESPIFDDNKADETAVDIVSDGHSKTAKVNATRLTTGMFIEAQPNSKDLRTKAERTFQEELSLLFRGKDIYIRSIGLFDVEEEAAQNMYSNNVEVLLGLSFPLQREEIKDLLKILS